MRQPKVAQRYAKALFDLALETNQLDAVKADVDTIRAVESRELDVVLRSPVIREEKKVAVFEGVFGGKVSKLTMQFFNLLFRKGREIATDEILDAFVDLYRQHKNIHVMNITTAQPVTAEMNEFLKSKLLKNDNYKDSTIEVRNIVDENIIGGFIVQLGDKLIDASIRKDLQEIKQQFIENMYVQKLR